MAAQTERKAVSSRQRIAGAVLLAAGILLGTLFNAVIIWSEMEASLYFGQSFPAEEQLETLECPYFLTAADPGEITMTVINDTERDVAPDVQVEISNPGLMRNIRQNVPVSAGESQRVHWTVSSEDVVFGAFIFIKVFQYRGFVLPSREDGCGIFYLPVGWISGNGFFAIWIITSLACIIAGMVLWVRNTSMQSSRNRDAARAIYLLLAAVVAGGVFGLLASWFLGLLMLAVTLLLTGATISSVLQVGE